MKIVIVELVLFIVVNVEECYFEFKVFIFEYFLVFLNDIFENIVELNDIGDFVLFVFC